MSVDPIRPRESKQDDAKMSDPSPSPPIQSLPPLESSEDEPSAGHLSLLAARDSVRSEKWRKIP